MRVAYNFHYCHSIYFSIANSCHPIVVKKKKIVLTGLRFVGNCKKKQYFSMKLHLKTYSSQLQLSHADLEKAASGASGACGHLVGNHAILSQILYTFE